MKTFGLLGRRLSHSFSPAVHAAFGDPSYHLFETEDPVGFLREGGFDGLNVTTPYKETVVPFLDELEGFAAATGSVNTIVRRDGRLHGYNTDVDGIAATFARHGVDPSGKRVAVIGNGGVSVTLRRYLLDRGAAAVDVYCRTPRREGEMLLTSAGGPHAILVNATPVGMHPDEEGMPVSLDPFPDLEFVFDLVYNPLRTDLLITAADRGIKTASGLLMLVMQARRARELFTGETIAEATARAVHGRLALDLANVVLIGLPLSGKSTFASRLAASLGKRILDTDAEIERIEGRRIAAIFAEEGEASFRAMEARLVERHAADRGLIVATGGGMVKDAEAMRRLRHNGIVVFLDKDYRKIMAADIRNRPLIQSPADVERLARERRPLYERYADVTVEVTGRHDETTREIEAKIHAHLDR
ncbi:MAG: shikimate kinase [Candidatus Izemoplasmatales bacterium]